MAGWRGPHRNATPGLSQLRLPAKAAVLIALALAVGVLAGCGGGSSSGTTEGGSTSTASSGRSDAPASGFSKKAKQTSFGGEASEEEREQASETLETNLSSRASGDYETQCETLFAPLVKLIEEGSGGAVTGKQGCAETLEAEAKQAPPGLLENPIVGPISVLRVEGKRGYALFHGKENQDYAMKMGKEPNGEWLVASTLTETLPQG